MATTDRRTEIIDAVERLLARGGVTAGTMRAVAAEAGVSLRLVQYYGDTKDALLSAALDRLAEKSVERWRARYRARPTAPMTIITAFFDEALPTDRAGREFHRVGVSLEAMAVGDPTGAGQAYRTHLGALAAHLTDSLRAAGLDASAARLLGWEVMGLAHGVGTLLMAGQLTAADTEALIGDYLDRLEPRLSEPDTAAGQD